MLPCLVINKHQLTIILIKRKLCWNVIFIIWVHEWLTVHNESKNVQYLL